MKMNVDRNPKYCRLCWFELGTPLCLFVTLRYVVESCRVYYKILDLQEYGFVLLVCLVSHPNNKSRVE